MSFSKEALVHPHICFERSTIRERKRKLGLTNENRIELFIWDLEIFCQIYRRLKNRVILKGGAAAQFYLPMEKQRTSIDIDMICSVGEAEIKRCLEDIEREFKGKGNLFKFRFHRPKEQKTELPLLTYFLTVPSEIIVVNGRKGVQEIKVEFFLDNTEWPAKRMKNPQIFAMETNQTYIILTLEGMIADKLTTLGPTTIGIPETRRDELCKQLYDLDGLLHSTHAEKHNPMRVKSLYLKRARLECESRKMDFDLRRISEDVMKWLSQLFLIDFKSDSRLEKDINDFQSLYLRKQINRGKGQWAIIGEKLRFYLSNLYTETPKMAVWKKALELEELLLFHELEGREKGEIIRKFKESFSKEFGKYSAYPQSILKSKNPIRQMWHVVNPSNFSEISKWILAFRKKYLNA